MSQLPENTAARFFPAASAADDAGTHLQTVARTFSGYERAYGLFGEQPPVHKGAVGRVAEWFKAAVLKTAVGASSPWVRIPPLPPFQSLSGH